MLKTLISFSLAALGSAWLLFAPAYTGIGVVKSFPASAELPAQSAPHRTLADVNGPRAYFLLAIPVVIAGLPLLFRWRAIRVLSAALLTGWAAIGAASIGLFYVPSAIMMIWSAFAESP